MDEKRKLAAEITRDIIVAIANKATPVSRKITVDGGKVAIHDYYSMLCRHWDEVFKTVYNTLSG